MRQCNLAVSRRAVRASWHVSKRNGVHRSVQRVRMLQRRMLRTAVWHAGTFQVSVPVRSRVPVNRDPDATVQRLHSSMTTRNVLQLATPVEPNDRKPG
mmetsp:Transcript_11187/g.33543  ORF Transcript_11187/g.33543 Transcript_11187/m.33543 type:complete len:98 (-) Transcript_11187:359-652(-)